MLIHLWVFLFLLLIFILDRLWDNLAMLEFAVSAAFSANPLSIVAALPAVSKRTLDSSRTFTYRVKGALLSLAGPVVEDRPLIKRTRWQRLIAGDSRLLRALESVNVLRSTEVNLLLMRFIWRTLSVIWVEWCFHHSALLLYYLLLSSHFW